MAVLKKINQDYTYQDLFDTQNALDTGILGSVNAGTTTTTTKHPWTTQGDTVVTSDINANASNLGSILGQTDAIAANKKRRLEQQGAANQGTGINQSILGGGAF